jgi:5-deoxy-glucuronate isomerase
MAAHRTYDLREGWDVTVTIGDGDVFLVPRGFHGPCMASPDHGLWYLNVLAGPGEVRSMAISDDPDHAWIRGAWADQAGDPRVPMTTEAGRAS